MAALLVDVSGHNKEISILFEQRKTLPQWKSERKDRVYCCERQFLQEIDARPISCNSSMHRREKLYVLFTKSPAVEGA